MIDFQSWECWMAFIFFAIVIASAIWLFEERARAIEEENKNKS